MIYAGAMLPKAYSALACIFKAIQSNPETFSNVEFHFIGTGKRPNDSESYNIKPIAERFGLWQNTIFEYAQRIPYLDVLAHLNSADGIFILGSTEPHYTPSKTYQAVLSGKPIFAVLHQQSSAVKVLEASNAGIVLSFDGEKGLDFILQNFISFFTQFLQFSANYKPEKINKELFEQYSAKNVTAKLAGMLEKLFAE